MIARRSARRERPLAPSEANPDGRPTRPDKLSIWPTDDERFGIDVLYRGAEGFTRAESVHRYLGTNDVASGFRQEPDGAWGIRFGPVSRDDMVIMLNAVVW